MSKKPIKKPIVAAPRPRALKKEGTGKSMFDTVEEHFAQRRNLYFYLLIALSVIFSFLSFDNKISTANDDALYIESGANYAKHFFGYFYTANAPLYPMFLGVLIKIIGVRLFWLKLFSVLFFALGITFVFKAFEKRIPYI